MQCSYCGVQQLFPQIEEIMVQPLRDSRDHYEELKQIDDAMTEVEPILFYLSIFYLSICTVELCSDRRVKLNLLLVTWHS